MHWVSGACDYVRVCGVQGINAMTDTDKLKRLAEAAREFEKFAAGALSCAEYLDAATPKTIIDLIAENERLHALAELADVMAEKANHAIEEGFKHVANASLMKQQRDEAVALMREMKDAARVGYGGAPVMRSSRVNMPASLWHKARAFLARIDAAE